MNKIQFSLIENYMLSCLLHDIARAEQLDDPKVCHAAAGGEKAYHFLVEHGFSINFAEKVKHCIQTHRFRKNNEPQMIQLLHSFRNISTSSKMYIQNFIPGKGKNLHGKEKTQQSGFMKTCYRRLVKCMKAAATSFQEYLTGET